MLTPLGSIPFCDQYMAEDTMGHWVIENDPGKAPRMYVDENMLGLIGLKEQTSPEDTFRAWFKGIDRDYLDSVLETERLNVKGIRAEVQYPWHYPDGHTILIRCEGIRNFAYTQGIRTEGRHRDITTLTRLQKQDAVVAALAEDFECVNYVILNENKKDDVVIPFRTSQRIRQIVPGWEQEMSFHNRINMLIDYVGISSDAEKFYAQTRREVILAHLENERAYFVNVKAGSSEENGEYFQFKFMADRDENKKIIGIIVGIHSIDAEMRQELDMREKVEKQVAEKTDELIRKNRALAKVNERIISMVGEIVESRDPECGGHIYRVSYLTKILGMQVMKDLPEYNLTVEDVSAISSLSPLHDIGKIKIPENILLKPGKLTPEEFDVIKTHCDKGCEVLEIMFGEWSNEAYKLSTDICRYHHEKWDGRGYPSGLKGDEIPISAQIVSIADVYDALVTERCYKKAYTHEEAYQMIMDGKCGKFSDKLLACLTKCRTAFIDSSAYVSSLEKDEADEDIIAMKSGEIISDAVPLIEELSQAMPGGFFIYQADEEAKLIYFNDLLVEYFGCTSREEFTEFVGNSFRGMVHPEDLDSVQADIDRQIVKTGNMDHVVYRILRKDGSIRWLDDYGRLISSGDMGNVFFVFVTDFTETYLRRNAVPDLPETVTDAESAAGVFQGLKVLVVDDSDITRELNCEVLEENGAIVMEAENGLEAVNAVRENMDFDLILMDIVMPVMSGVSAVREIKKLLDDAGRHTTIICLTAEGSDMQIKEALDAGAYECLYKPLSITELSGHVIASMKETSQLIEKQLADTLKLANTDALTNVFSIAAYTDKIADLTARLQADRDIEFGIVMCDCDNLKEINDTYGHASGDRYICNTSNIICSVFAHSPVYRIGGDEFVVILEGYDYNKSDELMDRLREKAAYSKGIKNLQAGFASFSSGFAVYDCHSDETVGSVIKRADVQMYIAKRYKI